MASGQDVAKAALSELKSFGGKISKNNSNKYNTWYYGTSVKGEEYQWCAVFVSYCCNKAKVPESIVPKTAWCGSGGMYDFVPETRRHPNGDGYVPSPGDFMLRKDKHIGIIVSCDGSSFTTVEGNTAGEGPSNRTVAEHTYPIGGNYTHIICPQYDEVGENYSANWVQREVPNIGKDLATKAWMAYQMITDTSTDNYKIAYASDVTTSGGGLRIKAGKYIEVAMGSYYGNPGTYVKIRFDDGNVIYCIITDEKKDSETDSMHMYHDYPFDRNVLEFVVDGDVVHTNDDFSAALNAQSINRAARITDIWTSDTAPEKSKSSDSEKITYFQNTNEVIPLHPTLFKQPRLIVPYAETAMYAADNDITQYYCDFSWSNTVDELATTMQFSVPKADNTKYLHLYVPQPGDIIRYYAAGNEMFRGVIISSDNSDSKINKYTAADAGWYLNKCMDTYQFTGAHVIDCLTKILNDLSVPVAELPEDLNGYITAVYIDKSISDIIKDILSHCSGRFNFDFVPDGIRIYRLGSKTASPQFYIASNVKVQDSIKHRFDVTHSVTVEDMVTAVKAVSDTNVLGNDTDSALYQKFGFIQKVINVSEDSSADYEINAEKVQNGKPKETFSFQIVESLDGYTRAGSSINTDDNCSYLITSTQHSITNGVHYNKIDLERIS